MDGAADSTAQQNAEAEQKRKKLEHLLNRLVNRPFKEADPVSADEIRFLADEMLTVSAAVFITTLRS